MPSYSKNHNNFETQESNAVELDESLETDLCLLWDMSADKEVAHCLFQHDILSLAKCVIEESVAPRLMVKVLMSAYYAFFLNEHKNINTGDWNWNPSKPSLPTKDRP